MIAETHVDATTAFALAAGRRPCPPRWESTAAATPRPPRLGNLHPPRSADGRYVIRIPSELR